MTSAPDLEARIITAVTPGCAVASWVSGPSFEDRLEAVRDAALAHRGTFTLRLDDDGTWAILTADGEVEGDGWSLADANAALDEAALDFARDLAGR